MVKKADDIKQEPTIATWIMQQIEDHLLISKNTVSALPTEISKLFNELQKIQPKQENNIKTLTSIVKNSYHNLSTNPQQEIRETGQFVSFKSFLESLLKELKELDANINTFGVNINSALDGYTLNKTTKLIGEVNNFLEDIETSTKKGESQPKSKFVSSLSSSFFSPQLNNLNHKAMEEEKIVAEQLKEKCEEIRRQIGSPESMPRALVISLVMHLHQAINCHGKNGKTPYGEKLTKLLSKEVDNIRNLFPELAQAGEDLQKAIENYGPHNQ
jgi:Zn-dependent M32 family carboxypeptidase